MHPDATGWRAIDTLLQSHLLGIVNKPAICYISTHRSSPSSRPETGRLTVGRLHKSTMPPHPSISVVMSVYNDAEHLAASIDSVLEQTECDFEFVIVNDGSTDRRVAETLAAFSSRDSRIRVISKANEGLTRALIDGCAAAKGKYIARIDVGDRYLSGRLAKQLRFMEAHPELALSSCWTRFVDDADITLVDVCPSDSPGNARMALRGDALRSLKGVTHHGSVMFRSDVYRFVGGYRPAFYFAQDVDLWVRMTDQWGMAFFPEILYLSQYSASGLSGLYHRQQIRLGEIIIRMRQNREKGLPEDRLLARAASIHPDRLSRVQKQRGRSRGEYFAGCQCMRGHPQAAMRHFCEAVRTNPLHVRAMVRLIQAFLLKGREDRR